MDEVSQASLTSLRGRQPFQASGRKPRTILGPWQAPSLEGVGTAPEGSLARVLHGRVASPRSPPAAAVRGALQGRSGLTLSKQRARSGVGGNGTSLFTGTCHPRARARASGQSPGDLVRNAILNAH
jgi:hypothetical protein